MKWKYSYLLPSSIQGDELYLSKVISLKKRAVRNDLISANQEEDISLYSDPVLKYNQ